MDRGDQRHRLTFEAREDQGVHVLLVRGDVDSVVEPLFRSALEKAVSGANSPLVIDLAGVGYLDTHGFAALIEAQRQMTARPDKLYLVVTNVRIRRTFSVLGLDKFFDLYLDAEDAMAAARKGIYTDRGA